MKKNKRRWNLIQVRSHSILLLIWIIAWMQKNISKTWIFPFINEPFKKKSNMRGGGLHSRSALVKIIPTIHAADDFQVL